MRYFFFSSFLSISFFSFYFLLNNRWLLKMRWVHDINENIWTVEGNAKRKSLSLFSIHFSSECALFISHRRNKMRISSSSTRHWLRIIIIYSENKDMINIYLISNIQPVQYSSMPTFKHTHTRTHCIFVNACESILICINQIRSLLLPGISDKLSSNPHPPHDVSSFSL